MSRWLIVLLILASTTAIAAEIHGRVISISDGDTFTLLNSAKQQINIRLAEIDAPEAGQPYGQKSKQALSDLVFGRDLVVREQATDRFGRTVGRPYVGGLDICEEMVRIGAAWAYRKYLRDEGLLALEAEAKADKRGLWGLSEAQKTPPWEWRRSGAGNQVGECQIKGNINSKGERIYHVPGSSSYAATKIDESNGERWFCSEVEARGAGWRKRKY